MQMAPQQKDQMYQPPACWSEPVIAAEEKALVVYFTIFLFLQILVVTGIRLMLNNSQAAV